MKLKGNLRGLYQNIPFVVRVSDMDAENGQSAF